MRVGYGYDLHRLPAQAGDGDVLVLGGVEIPGEPRLIGHSDADALLHAITDALLGAAGAGDIGQHFPDTDPRWKDADSAAFVREAAALVARRGFSIGNVDATVVAERPRLSPYREAMQSRVAELLGVEPGRASVKFTTNEGVGPVGRGEAIAAHAVALLVPESVPDSVTEDDA